MAVQPKLLYPAQIVTTDSAYPYGKARNDGTPGDTSGTPLEKAWVNDIWGFLQAILIAANVAPSGEPDKVGASQYLDALRSILDRDVGTRTALSNWNAPQPVGQFFSVASNPDGSIIVAVGAGVSASFDGGWTWSQQIPPSSSIAYTDVIWDGTRFVVLATGIPSGGFGSYHSTDGDTWIADTGGGAGPAGDLCESFNYDAGENVYVAGATTGKVFARVGLTGPVTTVATAIAPVNNIAHGVFADAPAFMAACRSAADGGLRIARPDAPGLWIPITGTITASDWVEAAYSATLGRWFAVDRAGDILAFDQNGGNRTSHTIPGDWEPRAIALVDDRQLLVVGLAGHVAFGEPNNLRTIKLNTSADLLDVHWTGREAFAASANGIVRSFSR